MKRALLPVLAGIAVAVGVTAPPSNADPVYACAWQMVTVTDVYGNYAYAWQRNCGWVDVGDGQVMA